MDILITINGGEKGEYGEDFMKIKFNTGDNLPLNTPLRLHLLTIIVRCIFEEDDKFYPQLYLDDCCMSFSSQATY